MDGASVTKVTSEKATVSSENAIRLIEVTAILHHVVTKAASLATMVKKRWTTINKYESLGGWVVRKWPLAAQEPLRGFAYFDCFWLVW